MRQVLAYWANRYFSHIESIVLLALIAIGGGLILTIGSIMAPILASLVLAFLLQSVVNILTRCKLPEKLSILVVYLSFLTLFIWSLLVVVPLLFQELTNLFKQLPIMMEVVKKTLSALPAHFPGFITQEQIDGVAAGFMQMPELRAIGKTALAASFHNLPVLIEWLVYLVLVPVMTFFFLNDSQKIMSWFTEFLPRKRERLNVVHRELNLQLGNYVRGKVAEALIMTGVTYIVFVYFGMPYTVLLSVLVGVSVFIPVVGAVFVSIPVILVALYNYGLDVNFTRVLVTYAITQLLDGYVLTPLLFSEAVDLHPLAILVAIILFGGLWGMWGVFFAIPLAILIRSVLDAWPRVDYYKPL